MTIHETVEALDAGPIAAQEAFPIGPTTTPGAVFERSAEVAARLLDAGARRSPSFTPQPEEGATYAEKIAPADRELDLADPVDAWRRVRALSPHIGAWATLHGRRVTVWRARLDDGALRARVEVQPEGRRRMSYDEFLRGVRRDRPGAAGRLRGRAPRLRGGGVRRPRARVGRRRARRARPRARAADRLRHGAAHARRSTTGSTQLGKPAGAQARPAGARRAAARRLPARLERQRRRTRSSTTRSSSSAAPGLERAVPFTNAVMRRLAEGFRGLVASLPDGPAEAVVPRLDRRDLGARLGARRRRSR